MASATQTVSLLLPISFDKVKRRRSSKADTPTHTVKTQHLLGASLFTRISETEAKGSWQARAWHTRTFEDGRVGNWDSSSFLEFTYVKIDGVWKIGGWRPNTVLASVGKHSDVLDTP